MGERARTTRRDRRGSDEALRRTSPDALRSKLEARLGDFRGEHVRLAMGPPEEARPALDRLLAALDAQHAQWQALAPDLLTGDEPARPETVPEQREVLRAMRKLAYLRARVLATSRGGRTG